MIWGMPRISVVVPWSGTCPHRQAAWSYVSDWYQAHHPGWPVLTGECEGGRWCKAVAVADAVNRTDADILVIADADCIAPHLPAAVEAVASGAPWAMPHHLVHRFSRTATAAVLGGTDPASVVRHRSNYTQFPYAGYPGGGITVVSRLVYESCPLDPRFLGWGQEDESWAEALGTLYGPPWRQRTWPLWHLWHPPQARLNRSTGSDASRALRSQYRALRGRQEAMRAHLEPGRALLSRTAPA